MLSLQCGISTSTFCVATKCLKVMTLQNDSCKKVLCLHIVKQEVNNAVVSAVCFNVFSPRMYFYFNNCWFTLSECVWLNNSWW
jgi:hypothetical protein